MFKNRYHIVLASLINQGSKIQISNPYSLQPNCTNLVCTSIHTHGMPAGATRYQQKGGDGGGPQDWAASNQGQWSVGEGQTAAWGTPSKMHARMRTCFYLSPCALFKKTRPNWAKIPGLHHSSNLTNKYRQVCHGPGIIGNPTSKSNNQIYIQIAKFYLIMQRSLNL